MSDRSPQRSGSIECEPLEVRRLFAAAIPRPDHVVIVVEENHSYDNIIESTTAPYLHSLIAQGASLTNYHAIVPASFPNYLALFSGTTHDVSDDTILYGFDSPNLSTQLRENGLTFACYSESLPAVGFTGASSGAYVRRHNPLPYFDNVPAEENRPFTDFPSDFSQLPTVSFVVPNLDNDMHDGTIGEGDTWLQDHLGDYVDWAATHNSILIVTFDEGLPNSDNHIATIFAGAHVIAGNNAQAANHYSLLGTVQEMYDLPPIAHTATAAPISGIWLEGEPPSPPPPPASDFDGRIRGRLFQDRNGNGKRNGGDAPLAGVTVFLDANQNDQFDAGETSTASAENGTYAFSGLAEGTHRVAVGLAGVWRTTTPTREVTFGRRHSVKAGAIGLTQNAALSGTLFNDANSDGAKQDPETGLRDWVVYVDLDGNSQRDRGEPKVRSNKNGEWRFASVSPGTYVVRVQPRRKFVPTIPADASRIGTLIGAQTVSDTLFGFLKS